MRNQIDDLGLAGITIQDWDERLAFPFKTLTTDYRTWITYISRKPVPANTPITDIRYWKPICRLQSDLALDYNNFKAQVNKTLEEFRKYLVNLQSHFDDIETQMQSFLATASGGDAFSNKFGNSEVMGVTQKALTTALDGIYKMLSDITGDLVYGVNIDIHPTSIIKGNNSINIIGSSDYGVFDSVKVYLNNILKTNVESVVSFNETYTITDTTTVRVEVIVLGQSYVKEKVVTMYEPFFVGAGTTYEDVFDTNWARPYDGDPKGQYKVAVEEGQRLYIILPSSDAHLIEQIEMNDFNIPMEPSIVDDFTVYTSLNTYQTGTYNIDINY